MGGLLIAEGKAVAADFEGDRIAQRRAAEHFDRCAVAEAHFEKATADIGAAADFDDLAAASHSQLVQGAGGRGAHMRASSEIAGLFHERSP